MPTKIELDELKDLVSRGGQLVEVLPAKEYERIHIPGAINIPLQSAARLHKTEPVTVYCYDFQ
jgi:rhodanese-related sulfurtransferase